MSGDLASGRRSGPRVAVVGVGAVGGYFGGLLARRGVPTVLIGRPAFVAAVSCRGLTLETGSFCDTFAVEASDDLSAVAGAEYVLVCVKSGDTEAVARGLAPHLAPGVVVVSLQNGVENPDLLRQLTGRSVIASVVYLAAAMPEPGFVKHLGRGDLILGPETAETRTLAELLSSAGIPCVVTDRIQEAQWRKFFCNVALNALSALGRVTYGEIASNADSWSLVKQVIAEAHAVAGALGALPTTGASEQETLEDVRALTTQISGAYSSTAQDLWRGRRTEIDALNGFIARAGKAKGLATPANELLWTLVRTAEAHRRFPQPFSA